MKMLKNAIVVAALLVGASLSAPSVKANEAVAPAPMPTFSTFKPIDLDSVFKPLVPGSANQLAFNPVPVYCGCTVTICVDLPDGRGGTLTYCGSFGL